MKRWNLVRGTLSFLGFFNETAKDVTAISIEDDATIHYKKGDVNFSGNITEKDNKGVDAEYLVDEIPTTIGTIIITNGDEISIQYGATETIILENEDGATINSGDVISSSTNGHASVSGLVISGDTVGSSTITFKLVTDNDVFSKIKVYVVE